MTFIPKGLNKLESGLRPLISCDASTVMSQVVRMMQENAIGCMLVRDTANHPVGIYSERDLLSDMAKGLYSGDLPVSKLMRGPVITAPRGATELDAMLLMIRHNIRHVVLTEHGVAAAVISERELFQKYPGSLGDLILGLGGAIAFEDIQQVSNQVRKLACDLVAVDLCPLVVGHLISEFNDRLASRILDIEWRTHGLDQEDGLSVCWLVLGSEARKEQPLNTDQDNALIFRVNSSKSEINIRTRLLAFAQNVNRRLDLCGLELCGGKVMAGNPDWCHSFDDWIKKIKSWNANPQPESILAATIFFDFRGVWGDLELEHGLRSWLVDFFRGRHRLIRGMAASALGTPSPIGLFSRFRLGSVGAEPDAIDLKSQGSRIFVDAARVESLMLGLNHVSTETRLRQAGHVSNIPTDEVDAMVASFVFILRLRLRLHLRGLESPTARLTTGEGLSLPKNLSANNLKPSELNKLEQETLREAFKQSRLLQKRLAMSLGI